MSSKDLAKLFEGRKHSQGNPDLDAIHSTRPAVHWFTYADPCARGREAGFHRFHSRFDGWELGNPSVARSGLRRPFLSLIKFPRSSGLWRSSNMAAPCSC